MAGLELHVVSLRYSSWSMRAWLALRAVGADFTLHTAELPDMIRQTADDGAMPSEITDLAARRRMGSVTGLFPVLWVDGTPVHEALAICEWVAEAYPGAGLWPADPLQRAQARAVCCEMASSFAGIRAELSCHPFARVPGYLPSPRTRADVERVFEIWRTLLERHGGPFLTGGFAIADCMYYPMLTRFRTYDVALPADLEDYAMTLEACEPVRELVKVGRGAPRIASYDDYILSLNGDPEAGLDDTR